MEGQAVKELSKAERRTLSAMSAAVDVYAQSYPGPKVDELWVVTELPDGRFMVTVGSLAKAREIVGRYDGPDTLGTPISPTQRFCLYYFNTGRTLICLGGVGVTKGCTGAPN